MRWLVRLLASWAWMACKAMAQLELSDAVSGSVSFMDAGIVSLAHIALFTTTLLRGRLDLETASRDAIAAFAGPPLDHIEDFGRTTDTDLRFASVAFLATDINNTVIAHFMRYISACHDVDSVLLRCLPLRKAAVTVSSCNCTLQASCHCLIIWTVPEITLALVARMPKTIKALSDNMCIIPSLQCLASACHGCDSQSLLSVVLDGGIYPRERLSEGYETDNTEAGNPAAVCETLDFIASWVENPAVMVCIPLLPAAYDDWTRFLIRSFRSADDASRGVRTPAADGMQSYLDGTRTANRERFECSMVSVVLPRLLEGVINVLLTGLFRVDGFTSALTARRAVRDFVVDSRGNGFFANVFFRSAMVHASRATSHVSQVLTFRSTLCSLRALSSVGCAMNMSVATWWSVSVTLGYGLGQWSKTYETEMSWPRYAAGMTGLAGALGMDCLHLYLNRWRRKEGVLVGVMVAEAVCLACGGSMAAVLGVGRGMGRWAYGVVHGMVWLKWGLGCLVLGEYVDDDSAWSESGILIYSSAFLLTAILAGIGGKWH